MIPDPGRASMVSTTSTTTASSGARRLGVSRKPTLGSIFKASLQSLMDTLGVTDVHYIRCIKPNEAKKAWEFTPQQVLGQLRACGVLETIRISCAGYPNRWTFEEFAERYTNSSSRPETENDLTSLLVIICSCTPLNGPKAEQTPSRSVPQFSNRRSRTRTNTKLASRKSSCERVCLRTSNPGALIASIPSPPLSRRISSELWRGIAMCACAKPLSRFKPGGVVSWPNGWCWLSGRRSPRGGFRLLPDDLCKGGGFWRCTTRLSSSKLVS